MPYTQIEKPVIQALASANGMQTRRFKKSLMEAVFPDGSDEDVKCLRDEYSWFRRVPDAFRLHPEHNLAIVLEVECSHKIPDHKMAEYAELWFQLDCDMWDLVLFRASDVHDPKPWCLMSEWYARTYRKMGAS